MFLLKKLLAPLLLPLPLTALLLAAGLLLLWFTRRQKAGKVMVTAASALLILLSYDVVSDRLLRPVERYYPPVAAPAAVGPPVAWVVVLGGGSYAEDAVPITSRLSGQSLYRLVEGIRLHRQLPGSRLILSGGSAFGSTPDAESMPELARQLGVEPQSMVLEAESRDTEDEVRLLKPVVGDARFYLVTSASHMPRAVALFTAAGMKPIPAPTNYRVLGNRELAPTDFYPSSAGLMKAEIAIYEGLGLLWAKLRGKA
jgi:uncharacterized SAM-binding protein YcdF (DUF218 family)